MTITSTTAAGDGAVLRAPGRVRHDRVGRECVRHEAGVTVIVYSNTVVMT